LSDAEGYFRTSPVGCGLRYFFQPGLSSQLEAEMRAQIEKYLATGLPLNHIDSHLNLHMHPTIFEILMRLCEKYGIRSIRVLDQPWWPTLCRHRQKPASKTLHAIAFRPLCSRTKRRLNGTLQYADAVYGLLESGAVNEEYLLELLWNLPDGLTEIYFHPAKSPCAEFRRWNPHYEAEGELRALCSDRVRQSIRSAGIQLLTYAKTNGG
jgi:predicted glycoside hydrolase/deacetylase ChbG (UPF0249 family)